ncbi:Imm10 family immunity protein [Nonomuraea sp. NPDC050556]|uniref:Imm10 family immunity protein n=1 Tax=Nonomuraea sp. NPDC050556 TaxID=3364369 RepID=UPI0037933D86
MQVLGEMVVRLVGRDEDDEVVTLGLSEDEDGEGRALIFMLAEDEDEPYCVTREYGSGTTYGGVVGWELTGTALTLRFSEEAARDLGVEAVVRVELLVDDAGVALVRAGLGEILTPGRS